MGPGEDFTAATMSSRLRGVTTLDMRTGNNRVTSFTQTLESLSAVTVTAGVREYDARLTATPNTSRASTVLPNLAAQRRTCGHVFFKESFSAI